MEQDLARGFGGRVGLGILPRALCCGPVKRVVSFYQHHVQAFGLSGLEVDVYVWLGSEFVLGPSGEVLVSLHLCSFIAFPGSREYSDRD